MLVRDLSGLGPYSQSTGQMNSWHFLILALLGFKILLSAIFEFGLYGTQVLIDFDLVSYSVSAGLIASSMYSFWKVEDSDDFKHIILKPYSLMILTIFEVISQICNEGWSSYSSILLDRPRKWSWDQNLPSQINSYHHF